MNDKKICFISCVNDSIEYSIALKHIKQLEIPEGYEIEIVTIEGAQSMTSGYNQGMKKSDAKYKVYIHQDVSIINKKFISNIIELFERNAKLGMIGVIGSKTVPKGVWWESSQPYGVVYHTPSGKGQLSLTGRYNVENEYEKVKVIDGLIMATQYDLSWREDLFQGWHFYDVSQCFEFINHGYDIGIPKQDTPWCIHDCGIISYEGFEKERQIFLKNYPDLIHHEWKKNNNVLSEINNYNPTVISMSAWAGHLNFGYDLVRFMKPKKIVELGTHYGASFYSFCQAVKDGNLSTKCFAVDTWKGDQHCGSYGEDVYQTVKGVVNKFYPNIATLVQNTFDEALEMFQDETVDILHIDGCHSYEAVSHDFQTWLPKVADKGIVLFHDIAVMDREFGVYKLWNTLKTQYPSIEFRHSFGLGVLFPKGHSEIFKTVLENKEILQRNYEM